MTKFGGKTYILKIISMDFTCIQFLYHNILVRLNKLQWHFIQEKIYGTNKDDWMELKEHKTKSDKSFNNVWFYDSMVIDWLLDY